MNAGALADRARIAARDAARHLLRSPLVALSAALALAVSLSVLALLVFTLSNTGDVLDDIARDLSATVYLGDDATREGVDALIQSTAADPQVAEVTFRTEEQEKARIVDLLSADLLTGVDDAAIPTQPVVHVRFAPELDEASFTRMRELTERLAAADGVASVGFEAEHVRVIFAIGDLVRLTGSILGFAALIVGLFFVALLVRVGLDRRADEIAMLRAVGATEAYVYAPMYATGALVGVAGGVLAIVISLLVDGRLAALAETAPNVSLRFDLVGPGLVAWCVLGGLGLALAGAFFSVRRHRS